MVSLKVKWLVVIALFFLVSNTYAQMVTPTEWQAIQRSKDYLIGQGTSTSIEEARQFALKDLAERITTRVRSQFDYVANEKSDSKGHNAEEKMSQIINTYSAVTLNNVSEYVEKSKSQVTVYRYMKSKELRDMFKRRINMAKKWAQEAREREKEGKIGDALQDFYWALALLRSCPDGDLETITQENGNPNMIQDVFHRVKDILGDIRIKASSIEKEGNTQRVVLDILYKEKPVVNFNYKYINGKQISEVFTAKDGVGELQLPRNASLGKLKVFAEYECRDEANIHPDLRSVMESTDPVPFSAAEFKVDTKGCPQVSHDNYVMQIATSASQSVTSTAAVAVAAPSTLSPQEASRYLPAIESIEKGIAKRDYSSLSNYFTSEGWDMFQKLVTYGDAKLLRSPEVSFFRSRGQVVCRSFPMSFTFKGNKRIFTEDVVFYMSQDGKVSEVAFGLEQAAVTDIMDRGQWSEEARHTMVHFLETYKTAYALKRYDYINSIFSNEALIITGAFVKPTGKSEISPAKLQNVKYTRQTKEQYMQNLKKCFASNEYINIRFADNIVRKSKTPNIYGIQIKQDYFSSSYGDTGYLFLLIDFKDPEAPLIHVRTWQPDNDPNVRDGRIGIADFNL